MPISFELLYCNEFNLVPSQVHDKHFWMLIEMSSIRSRKVIHALRDYLVKGFTRIESCERHKVSVSYFSLSMKKMSYMNNIAAKISVYYSSNYKISHR